MLQVLKKTQQAVMDPSVAALQDELVEWEAKSEERTRQVTALRRTLDDNKAKAEGLKSKVEHWHKREELRQEQQLLKLKIKAVEFGNFQEDVKALKDQVEAEKVSLAELQATVEPLEAELEDLEKQRKKREEQFAKLNRTHTANANQLVKMSSEMDQLAARLEAKVEELQTFSTVQNHKRIKLEKARADVAELLRKRDALPPRPDRDRIRKELAAREHELKRRKDAIAEVCHQLRCCADDTILVSLSSPPTAGSRQPDGQADGGGEEHSSAADSH